MNTELPPQQFPDKCLPRFPRRVTVHLVPNLDGRDFAEMQMRRQHRGAVHGWVVAADVIAVPTTPHKRLDPLRAPASPGVQVSRKPAAQSGCFGSNPQSSRLSDAGEPALRMVAGAGSGCFRTAECQAGIGERRVDAVGAAGPRANRVRMKQHSRAHPVQSGAMLMQGLGDRLVDAPCPRLDRTAGEDVACAGLPNQFADDRDAVAAAEQSGNCPARSATAAVPPDCDAATSVTRRPPPRRRPPVHPG